MPELPEVETVVRDLVLPLTGERILSVWVSRKPLRRRWSARWGRLLAGHCIDRVHRRGKWILIDLDDGGYLSFHLGMSGQLTVVPAGAPRLSHTHMVIALGSAEQLRFRDIRRFGCATVFADAAELDAFFKKSKLGPEPFELDRNYWAQRLQATRRCLKAALLDQCLVAGVGNIYADESLFEARLPPTLRGTDIDPKQAERLRRAIVKVLVRAINRRGSSIQNYVGGSGLRGEYQHEFRVYGRTGEPCNRCCAPIARIRLAGRSTHFCPQCQKAVVSG